MRKWASPIDFSIRLLTQRIALPRIRVISIYLSVCPFLRRGYRSQFCGDFRVGCQSASARQISSKSVKRLQRYGDLTVFKMAAVSHLGFVKFDFFNVLRG